MQYLSNLNDEDEDKDPQEEQKEMPKTRLQIIQAEEMNKLQQVRMLNDFKRLVESHQGGSIATSLAAEESMHQVFMKSNTMDRAQQSDTKSIATTPTKVAESNLPIQGNDVMAFQQIDEGCESMDYDQEDEESSSQSTSMNDAIESAPSSQQSVDFLNQ
jgi:hypothetical protein